MNNIILQIKNAIEDQGISETKAAALAGIEQSKVNRLLGGKTKKLDFEVVGKLQTALGLVSEAETVYAGSASHQQITPEESELLRYFRQLHPPQKDNAMQMIKGLLLLAHQLGKNDKQEEDFKELKSA